jgi:Flp pilus assembly protein TadG
MKLFGNREHASRPRGAGEAGNAMAEFALAAPILMILVLVTADYASLTNATVNLWAATQGAAEYAKANPTATGSTVAAYGNFPAGVTPTVSTFCTCTNNSSVTCPAAGALNPCGGVIDRRLIKYVAVSATQTFAPWFSYAGFAFPSSLSASTSLRFQ